MDEIQRQYQRPFAAKRQQYNTQMRVLRRTRIASDSAAVIREEKLARQLHQEMRGIPQENEAIRKLLTPEQDQKFAAYLKLRREMVGSSRDDKEFTGK
ncbi:MAG: hypothetical protein OHK0021_17140 [Bryobacter sp.]